MLPIKVPPLGESIVEATVSKWHAKEGDAVAAGDTLGELDESAVPVSSASTGANVGGAAGAPASPASPRPIPEPTKNKDGGLRGAAGAGYAGAPAAPSQSETTKSSPAARRIADERGIDIAAVAG